MTVPDPANPTLDAKVLAAHQAQDKAALVTLYTQAADSTKDTDAACFFLTYAYIYALEIGHPNAAGLAARLRGHGRI